MSPQQADRQQIIDEVNRQLERDRTRPLKIAIMGKSSIARKHFCGHSRNCWWRRTYHQGNFNISAPNLGYNRYNVYYQGLLYNMTNEYFKKRFPDAQAKKYCNMMLIDGAKGQIIFDMATAKL